MPTTFPVPDLPPESASSPALLAQAGWRSRIAPLLPATGPLTRDQADAWLEAHIPLSGLPPLRARISSSPGQDQSPLALIAAEEALARGEPATFPDGPLPAPAAARLAAAKVRQNLADTAVLNTPGGLQIPHWEREWLLGLIAWRLGESAKAQRHLHSALAQNAGQTCVRLALATLSAPENPAEALALLEHPAPSREMLIASLALAVRVKDDNRIRVALTQLTDQSPGWEAPRYSWEKTREWYRRQENLLRVALAEQAGDRVTADKYLAGLPPLLQAARKAVFASRKLGGIQSSGWQADMMRRQVARTLQDLRKETVTGDCLFFRAILQDQASAVRDLEMLLRQTSWTQAEQRVGGGRLILVGDLLVEHGKPDRAVRAYTLADAAERQAIAKVLANPPGRSQGKLSAVVAAAKLLANDDLPAALALTGLPESDPFLCRVLRAACGQGTISEQDLAQLALPAPLASLLWLVCGEGDLVDRFEQHLALAGVDAVKQGVVNEETIRALLSRWCDDKRYAEAIPIAAAWRSSGTTLSAEMAFLVGIRAALALAMTGDVVAAEKRLAELEASL